MSEMHSSSSTSDESTIDTPGAPNNDVVELSFAGTPRAEDLTERRKAELKCVLEGWLNDVAVFDYLRMKAPSSIVVDPVVWNDEYDLEKHDVPVSRDTIGSGLILIPVCSDHHWCLIAFDVKIGLLVFFDTMRFSLGSLRTKALTIAQKLQASYGTVHPATGEHLAIKLKTASGRAFPEQEDGSSCGALVCMIGERIANGQKLEFTQQDVREWRKQAYEYLVVNQPPPVPRRRRKEMKKE